VEITYSVVYERHVVRDDIARLSSVAKGRIQVAIEQKLFVHPEIFGIPLRRSLRGYRKLRVGDYRVVFCIEGRVVKIFAIAHRSIVYPMAEHRI